MPPNALHWAGILRGSTGSPTWFAELCRSINLAAVYALKGHYTPAQRQRLG